MNTDELLEKLDDFGVEIDDAIDRVGDEDAYVGYLKRFVENQDMTDLENAVAEHDALKGEHAVHALKGNALTLGLLPFADVCIDMLGDYRSGNAETAEQKMTDVRDVFDELKEMITQG